MKPTAIFFGQLVSLQVTIYVYPLQEKKNNHLVGIFKFLFGTTNCQDDFPFSFRVGYGLVPWRVHLTSLDLAVSVKKFALFAAQQHNHCNACHGGHYLQGKNCKAGSFLTGSGNLSWINQPNPTCVFCR